MTESTERLAALVDATMLADRRTLTRTVSYAIEHSMSALHTANTSARASASSHVRVVFDWFVALARAFRSIPTGCFRLAGDGVWISKDVVISLSVLAESRPDLVAAFREHHVDGVKYPCGPETARAFREAHFEGELLRQVLTRYHTFGNLGPFTSGKAFMEYAFMHARRSGAHLHSLELSCASVFRAWRVDVDPNVPPWRRRWRAYETLDPPIVTFRGQRAAASAFLGVRGDGETCGAETLPFRGRWILGAGTDASLRSALLADTFGRGWTPWSPWASILIPWVSPSFVDAVVARSHVKQHERVRAFLRVAAVLDAAPEAYDLGIDAWIAAATDARLRERMRRVFPHMTRAIEKVARFAERVDPPDALCAAIVRAAGAHAQRSVDAAGGETFHDVDAVYGLRETPPPDVGSVVRALRGDGCFGFADAVEAYAGGRGGACDVFAYGADSAITWVDVSFSREHVWVNDYEANDVPVAARGASRHFMVVERDRGAPRVRAHPLSTLMRRGGRSHPLRSPRADLLAACA